MSHYTLPDPSLLTRGGVGPRLLATTSSSDALQNPGLRGELSSVLLGDVLPFVDGGPLDFAVGFGYGGGPIHADLAELGSLLVSGGSRDIMPSDWSIVTSIIMSILMRATPDEVRLILVDSKKRSQRVILDGIPHLLMPQITDMHQAVEALQWCAAETERRLERFSGVGANDLKGYNELVDRGVSGARSLPSYHLPSIVMVVDELADLMMVAKKDVEASIVRIAQLGRAAGVHLVLATQSPRADVVTDSIRANVACRACLKVAKSTDSEAAIGQTGAEELLGLGDMLFLLPGENEPLHVQGCYVTIVEIGDVVDHWKDQASPEWGVGLVPPSLPGEPNPLGDGPLVWQAAQLVVGDQLGSTSMLQRRLNLGYARAGRVMDMLEEMGVVGPARGSKPRDVLVGSLDELAAMRAGYSSGEEALAPMGDSYGDSLSQPGRDARRFCIVRATPEAGGPGAGQPMSLRTVAMDLCLPQALKCADELEKGHCELDSAEDAHYYVRERSGMDPSDFGRHLDGMDFVPVWFPLEGGLAPLDGRSECSGLRGGDSVLVLADGILDCAGISCALAGCSGTFGVPTYLQLPGYGLDFDRSKPVCSDRHFYERCMASTLAMGAIGYRRLKCPLFVFDGQVERSSERAFAKTRELAKAVRTSLGSQQPAEAAVICSFAGPRRGDEAERFDWPFGRPSADELIAGVGELIEGFTGMDSTALVLVERLPDADNAGIDGLVRRALGRVGHVAIVERVAGDSDQARLTCYYLGSGDVPSPEGDLRPLLKQEVLVPGWSVGLPPKLGTES